MITKVGTQTDFLEALKDLLELEYDIHAAYDVAIEKIQSEIYKGKMYIFKKEHEQHISQINNILEKNNIKPNNDGSIKSILTKGKVCIANLFNDKMILQAMHSNEIDTNTAYERLCKHQDKWLETEEILAKAWEQERQHKVWLKNILAAKEKSEKVLD